MVKQYDESCYSGCLFMEDGVMLNITPYFFHYKNKYFFVGTFDYLVSKFFNITENEKKFYCISLLTNKKVYLCKK